MQCIEKVLPGETITHEGDLTICGDIGSGAKINVIKGSLIVNGNVQSGVTIDVTAPEQNYINTSITVGSMSFGVTRTNGNVTLKKTTYSMSINDKYFIGNVNFDNRILTDGMLVDCKEDGYLIKAAPPEEDVFSFVLNGRFLREDFGKVSATVDGVLYTGTVIKVKGTTVFVDGELATSSQATKASVIENKPQLPAKVLIKGTIADRVQLSSDAPIEAKNIGKFCTIISRANGLFAENIGDGTTINTRDAISVKEIGSNCSLTSTHYGLNAENIGDGTKINTRDAISVKEIGSNCRLTSTHYGLNAGNIGDGTTIITRDAISVQKIGSKCGLTSTNYGLEAGNIGNGTTINTRDAITIKDVGSNCSLTSTNYGLNAGTVGNETRIKVRDGIVVGSIGNWCYLSSEQYGLTAMDVANNVRVEVKDAISVQSLGDNCTVTSKQYGIKVSGAVGSGCTIEVKDAVQLRDVGARAKITSLQYGVSINNIGNDAVISAKDGIEIKGSCPDPDSLTLKTKGSIKRPIKGSLCDSTVSQTGIWKSKP